MLPLLVFLAVLKVLNIDYSWILILSHKFDCYPLQSCLIGEIKCYKRLFRSSFLDRQILRRTRTIWIFWFLVTFICDYITDYLKDWPESNFVLVLQLTEKNFCLKNCYKLVLELKFELELIRMDNLKLGGGKLQGISWHIILSV